MTFRAWSSQSSGGDIVTPLLHSLDAITMFVDDRERSKVFYSAVFGLEPIFEDANSVVFKLDNTIVNLLELRAAGDLIHPATPATGEGGSRFQLTVEVNDADAVCSELHRRGVQLLNGPMNRPWGIRTASFKDPDGHIWEVAAPLSRDGQTQ